MSMRKINNSLVWLSFLTALKGLYSFVVDRFFDGRIVCHHTFCLPCRFAPSALLSPAVPNLDRHSLAAIVPSLGGMPQFDPQPLVSGTTSNNGM